MTLSFSYPVGRGMTAPLGPRRRIPNSGMLITVQSVRESTLCFNAKLLR